MLRQIVDQSGCERRCEWGARGIETLAHDCDVVIIVDVLSFSTAVDIAVSRGATVEASADYQRSVRTLDSFSLSPASLVEIPDGYHLVLPSPNGAALSLLASGKATFTACLRNASAVARAAAAIGSTFAVIPAGERWADGSLRPAIEDWIGAGAVLAALPGRASPEAAFAVAAFETARGSDGELLRECSSGRELIERGFARDVDLASELDKSSAAPMLSGCNVYRNYHTR
jgi:2-phosphosulfolactate phosphatase